MPANKDRSTSVIVKMPKLYSEQAPECRCWFEAGVIFIESCADDGECVTCSVDEFEKRLNVVQSYILDENYQKLVCGKEKAHTFLEDARKLIAQAKNQLHVGMPIEMIAQEEASRKPVAVPSGVGRGRFDHITKSAIHYPAGFAQRKSGLYVPVPR
jgi:hypothetical protein